MTNAIPPIVIDGVTVNVVQITFNAVSQTGGNPSSGHLHFEVNDLVWVTALNAVTVIDPVDVYANGGFAGQGSVNLLAMDNPGFSTNWAWILSGDSMGFSFPPRLLTVNFANGPQQPLTSLLAASTLVPAS